MVEYSWQTHWENALKYPMILCWALCSVRIRSLDPPHMSPLLYLFNNDVMLSYQCHCHITAHIIMQSFCDSMLFWQETHAHAFRCVSGNLPLRACPLVWPCSKYFYRIGDFDPGPTPWHIYVGKKNQMNLNKRMKNERSQKMILLHLTELLHMFHSLLCYAKIGMIGLTPYCGTNYKITINHSQAYNRHPWISTNQQQPITGQENQTHYPSMQVWNQTSYLSMHA